MQNDCTIVCVQCYNESIAIVPDERTYSNRAMAHISLRHYELAIRDYTSVLASNDKDGKCYWRRGLAYQELKQYIKAESGWCLLLIIFDVYL